MVRGRAGRNGRPARDEAPGWLEVDLVDDAEADERGEAERDADGEQVNIDGQPKAGVRLRGAGGLICVRGCHGAPWCFECELRDGPRAVKNPPLAPGADAVGFLNL